jgi:hypothetical protein
MVLSWPVSERERLLYFFGGQISTFLNRSLLGLYVHLADMNIRVNIWTIHGNITISSILMIDINQYIILNTG